MRVLSCLVALVPLVAAVNYKCPTAKVISAGKKGGNKAEFYLDDVKVEDMSSRGINVVVLDPVTLEETYKVFDVSGDAKQNVALKDYLDGLSHGTIVMGGVEDSGAEKLDDDARDALRNCGATMDVPVGGKEGKHWAFIGFKGMRAGTAVSKWDKRDSPAVEIEGQIACWPAGRSQCHIAKVVSQGFKSLADKGKTEFYIDDSEVYAGKFDRGFNVVTIDPLTMASSFATFDTNKFFGGEGTRMAEYIFGLKMGTIVMIGVKDDGEVDLNDEARDALKFCGGHEGADELGYREGYALVGYVGAGEGNGMELYGEGEVTAEGRMNCWWADRCPMATVQSAGGDDGEVPLGGYFGASVGGVRVPEVVWGRGVNILTLKPDGSHHSFEAFDTWQAISGADARDRMIEHIKNIPYGYTVLAGTADSANTRMNTEAYDAFRMIGGRGSDGPNFDMRASWALFGYKGQQSGEAYERYETDGQVHISAPVHCSQCPLCRVESAGLWDGDFSKFSMMEEAGGEFKPLPFQKAKRGVNMVVLDINGKEPVDGFSRNFDTWYDKDAAPALVDFIDDDISWGQTVLLGLRDSAELQMTDEAYESLTVLGHEGDEWTDRNNHAMIGMKGLMQDHATEDTKENGGRLFNKGHSVTVIAPSYCNEAKYVFLPFSNKMSCSNWDTLWRKQFAPYTDEVTKIYSDLFENPGACANACQRSAGCNMFEHGQNGYGHFCALGMGDCKFEMCEECHGQYKMYAPSDVPEYTRKKGSYRKGCAGNDDSGLGRVYDSSFGPGNEDRCAVLCQMTPGCRAFEVGMDETGRYCTVWQKTCALKGGKNTDIHYQYDLDLPNRNVGEECMDTRECEPGLMCGEGRCRVPGTLAPSLKPTASLTFAPTRFPTSEDPTVAPTGVPTAAPECGDGFGKLKMKKKDKNYKKSQSAKGIKTTCECEEYCDNLDRGYPIWVLSVKGGKCQCYRGEVAKVKKDKKQKTKYEDGQD